MLSSRGWSSVHRRFRGHRAAAKTAPAPEVGALPYGADTAAPAPRRVALGGRSPRWLLFGALLLAAGLVVLFEVRTSRLEAVLFSALVRGASFGLEPGSNPAARFPGEGPYDTRLGYSRLSAFWPRLLSAGYRIDSQARLSPRLLELGEWGLFPPYREKTQAGLHITDRDGRSLYDIRDPARVYASFEAIPTLVVETLLFRENRHLLDARHPYRNPAVDWTRLGRAVGVDLLAELGHERRVIGASTLATQLEKFRHSPDGQTRSAKEKLRQMLSASLRAYQGGADTLAARHRIVVDYLNAAPLGGAPGHGEVHGLGDGLWAWYGVSFAETNALLADPAAPAAAARALAYKRALSLILAARRPSYYLVENRPALEVLADRYLRVLARAGVIDARLRDLALGQALGFRTRSPSAPSPFTERKGVNLVRARLATLLGVPALYDLDRLDLAVATSLDGGVQERVTRILESLRSATTVAALGLRRPHLLARGDPSRVIYSFTLSERGPGLNPVRVQTDSLDQPFDLNAGARLDLGSTAKLRTLVTYLELVTALHRRYAGLSPADLRAVPVDPRDRLTAWALDDLASAPDRRLDAMLEAALARRYSASPYAAFFTGSGQETFQNFDPQDDTRILTVREAFRRSVNLVFIRLMRDVVNHYLYAAPDSLGRVVENPDDPRRQAYLIRFADREGSEFLRRFYRTYQGKTPAEALDLLLASARRTPEALATVLRSVDPEAGIDALEALLATRLPEAALSDGAVATLYAQYAPARYSLVDRGYIARVHPLELWLVAYLRQHAGADLDQVLRASDAERQAVYGWLFKTRRRHAQDRRIASLLELQAFLEIHRDWQRLGYPFASLTPSLATAIGASGDRPAALAELMGVIANGGIRAPTVLVDRLDFAAGTPYEARLSRVTTTGARVMTAEVAAVTRRALVDVVAEGTAQGLRPALASVDGGRHVVGGKTGTGDHRYDTFGPGGRLIASRVIDRAATFAFVIDDRFFGTVTAYVPGPQAARYEFTSALPVRVLGLLMPALSPLLDAPPSR